MIRQRLRGVLGTAIAACIPWSALGLVTGIVFQFNLLPGVQFGYGGSVPGGLVTICTLVGAVVGAMNGVIFSSIVLATECGKQLAELRASRFALWGALATGGTFGLLLRSPLAAGLGVLAGAIGGIATLSLSRRAVKASTERAALTESEYPALGAPST